jgi:hypothetical protein
MNWYIVILFIVALALCIYTRYYMLSLELVKEEIEAFENETAMSDMDKLKQKYNIEITYLSGDDARNVFIKTDQYLQNMNQANLAARKCTTLNDLYDKYMSGLSDISDDEKSTVISFMYNLLEEISSHDQTFAKYVAYWLRQISFAKGQDWLESGMPHTLGTTIIMDGDWFLNPSSTTLLHEITHVHQRKYFYDFEDLYAKLGYIYYPKLIKGMEAYYQLNRNNPDGSSIFWLWHNPESTITDSEAAIPTATNGKQLIRRNSKAMGTIPEDTNNSDYWWIGAVFKSANPINVTDVNYISIKLERGADGSFYNFNKPPIKLENFSSFNKYFGITNNNYHPNETSAKYMELYYNDKIMSPDRAKYYEYEGFKIFKEYFDDLIGKFYNK